MDKDSVVGIMDNALWLYHILGWSPGISLCKLFFNLLKPETWPDSIDFIDSTILKRIRYLLSYRQGGIWNLKACSVRLQKHVEIESWVQNHPGSASFANQKLIRLWIIVMAIVVLDLGLDLFLQRTWGTIWYHVLKSWSSILPRTAISRTQPSSFSPFPSFPVCLPVSSTTCWMAMGHPEIHQLLRLICQSSRDLPLPLGCLRMGQEAPWVLASSLYIKKWAWCRETTLTTCAWMHLPSQKPPAIAPNKRMQNGE